MPHLLSHLANVPTSVTTKLDNVVRSRQPPGGSPDRMRNMIIRESCHSFFFPLQHRQVHARGKVLCMLVGSDTLSLGGHHTHVATLHADPMCAVTLHASLILMGQQPPSHRETQPLGLKKHIRPAQVSLCN